MTFRAPNVVAGVFSWAAIIIVVAAVVAGVLWKEGFFKKSYAVPNLVGMTTKQASSAIASDGYTLNVTDAYSPKVAANDIISQTPAAGDQGEIGRRDRRAGLQGSRLAAMPAHLVGESCTAAASQLDGAAREIDLSGGGSDLLVFDHGEPNRSRPLSWRPESDRRPPRCDGDSRALEGATTVGDDYDDRARLHDDDLTHDNDVDHDHDDTAPGGSRAVPNVVGDNYAQTVAAMKKAVLYFTTEGPGAGTTTWTKVVSEDPIAGTKVAYKSTVILHVQ